MNICWRDYPLFSSIDTYLYQILWLISVLALLLQSHWTFLQLYSQHFLLLPTRFVPANNLETEKMKIQICKSVTCSFLLQCVIMHVLLPICLGWNYTVHDLIIIRVRRVWRYQTTIHKTYTCSTSGTCRVNIVTNPVNTDSVVVAKSTNSIKIKRLFYAYLFSLAIYYLHKKKTENKYML